MLPKEGTHPCHEWLVLRAAHAGGVEALVGHSEVVMCDFAACLLAELERWMLSATPAMIDLNSFADTSDYFTAPSSALEEVSKRLYTDEVTACCYSSTCLLGLARVGSCRVTHQMLVII